MHAVTCRSLLLYRSTSLRSCRYVAGRRFPVRTFRTSRPFLSTSSPDKGDGAPTHWQQPLSDLQRSHEQTSKEEGGQDETIASNPEPPEPPDEDPGLPQAVQTAPLSSQDALGKASKSPYGSAKRRMSRNVARKQESIIVAPPQFIDNNIKLWRPLPEGHEGWKEINGGNASESPDEDIYPSATVGGGSYQINRDVLFEVQASVNAGLRPTWAGEADSLAAWKAHLVLQSPKDGGQAFLDAVVANAAQRCRADVVTLEAQDIAEFVADNDPNETPTSSTGSLATLGYDTHMKFNDGSAKEDQYEVQEDGSHQEDDVVDLPPHAKSARPSSKGTAFIEQPMVVYSVSTALSDLTRSLTGARPPSKTKRTDDGIDGGSGQMLQGTNGLVVRLVEAMMSDSVLAHKASLQSSVEGGAAEAQQASDSIDMAPRAVILHIKDYLEISATHAGSSLIRNLHDMILNRRKEGARVLLVGTTSSEDLLPAFSQDGWRDVQNEGSGPNRTIIVPCTSPDANDILKADESNRIREINIRHLQDMIRRLTYAPEETEQICRPGNMQLQTSSVFASGLAEEVWSFEHMQRLAHTALGLAHRGEELNVEHVEWALNIIQSSDSAKVEWLEKEKTFDKSTDSTASSSATESKEALEERMKKLRKKCNTHEKRLLNGLIDRSGLKITFSDVQTSPSTIDALKNLTSLSLTRPEAFTYGVLAAEKIPGLLLYGPPGTGKTLLAKAVAKESGATILEVSGADIYDMYVGEGEKNVRAIFSLARKVSPCVVFIDEADALFGQRTNAGTRNTHREVVNQFLREWDGMSENSTFIMVATNRPFDLDDAVLRRLPRRILVDLPSERDREAILKIHLKDEQLAEDVAIDKLAQKTPFYSGSDLKNVCVSAALAAVREETEAATAKLHKPESDTNPEEITSNSESQSKEKHLQQQQQPAQDAKPTPKYPDRRTLRSAHFEKALSEISASISDDMSSLNAIRRFDEKYGDRKGRKKRPGGYGFGLVTEKEREKYEDGRVRSGQQQPES